MHRQTEARTGARGACARIGEKLTPMKPPAPHTSTVVPLPLPISIGIVSGRVFPWVQLRVTGRRHAGAAPTPVRGADKCLRHALRQRRPRAGVRADSDRGSTWDRATPARPAAPPPRRRHAASRPPARPNARPHAPLRPAGAYNRRPPRGLAPRAQSLRGQRRRSGGGGAARGHGAVAVPSARLSCLAATAYPPPPRRPARRRIPRLRTQICLPRGLEIWAAASTT